MTPRPGRWLPPGLYTLLATLVLHTGCASTPRHDAAGGSARQYAQATDSATSGCLRNPACYAQPASEAPLPWLSRAMAAARTSAAVLRLLEAGEVARVEAILLQCARDADFAINEQEYGEGKRPDDRECVRIVGQERGEKVTRAMQLGQMKHQRALECVRRELGKHFPDNFSVEPTYKFDPGTGRWWRVDPGQVARWVADGLFKLLLGTLVPDVVLHASGDPNRVQRVYDLKFPCTTRSKSSLMTDSSVQEQLNDYRALSGDARPAIVTPQLGVQR